MAAIRERSFKIRRAQIEDAAQVAKLGALVFSITFGHSVTQQQLQAYLNESYSIEAIARDIESCFKDMILATNEDGIVIGFALLTRGTSEPCIAQLEKTIELQRVYVHPAWHGNGVGKTLLREAEDTAAEHGYQYVWLGVWEENQKAQKVYEKTGYRVVGDHVFTIGEIVQTDHIMIKAL